MEQFTTSFQKVLDRLKEEFFDFENKKLDNTIRIYLAYPQTFYYHGLTFYKEENELKCLLRYWNIPYDMERFKFRIYNIDRLAIRERILIIDDSFKHYFNTIEFDKLNTVKLDGLYIGGRDCELEVFEFNKKLKWSFDKQMNLELAEFVLSIKSLIEKQGFSELEGS